MVESLKVMQLSVGRSHMKAKLVMLQVSLEGSGCFVFDRMTIGSCWSRVCRILLAMEVGMSVSRMLVVHLACLLASKRSP